MATPDVLKGIPQPPKTFLLGNLPALRPRTAVQDMMALARQYGPIYWLDIRGKPFLW